VWHELPPEVVNVKTGGILKTIGTAGIVKGDVNGHVNGLHSPKKLASPVTLPSLGTGDYGLLPPASTDPNASSGRIGKIFSFWIVE
jgi:hypothetical protein